MWSTILEARYLMGENLKVVRGWGFNFKLDSFTSQQHKCTVLKWPLLELKCRHRFHPVNYFVHCCTKHTLYQPLLCWPNSVSIKCLSAKWFSAKRHRTIFPGFPFFYKYVLYPGKYWDICGSKYKSTIRRYLMTATHNAFLAGWPDWAIFSTIRQLL